MEAGNNTVKFRIMLNLELEVKNAAKAGLVALKERNYCECCRVSQESS